MSWTITGTQKVGDPHWSNVSLLLHGNGTNGSQSIIDSSPSPKTMTAVGNAQINTTITDPFGRTGVGVLAFDGNGDYFSTPANSGFDLGAGDFTIEAWVRLAAHPSSYAGSFAAAIIGQSSDTSLGWFFGIAGNASQNINLVLTHGVSTQTTIGGTANLALNTWYHMAAVRSGNTIYVYLNGNLTNGSGTSYTQTVKSSTTTLKVGALDYDMTYKYWLNGQIDDLRITKGVARYTANFTPPTAPFPDPVP